MARTILVVDDETTLRETLVEALEMEGYRAVAAADGRAALETFRAERPDLVLLDLMLPELSGVEVCRILRAESAVPIIMLTAKDSEVDKVVGLELGADDYVTKPFSPRELATRVKTVLRRVRPGVPPRTSVAVGALVIDAAKHEVLREGEPLQLTAREFELLWFLASNPNNVFSRDQLMHRVWGYSSALDTGTVTVHMRRLREKVERDPSHPQLLETVWGVGYRLRA